MLEIIASDLMNIHIWSKENLLHAYLLTVTIAWVHGKKILNCSSVTYSVVHSPGSPTG